MSTFSFTLTLLLLGTIGAVEQLLEAGMQVYPLNPTSAQAYRQRKAPSGVKDDWLDAWSFADALRVDGQNWKPLRPQDPLIKDLRLLCRDEVGLIEQRAAFINQLRHALAEYYPTTLEAFEDWGVVSAWMFLQRFPTPHLLEKAGKRQWEDEKRRVLLVPQCRARGQEVL
jgi:transposase